MGQTRRDFLKIGSGALISGCAGPVAGGTRPAIKTAGAHYGASANAKKALVLYATRAGSTAEVADFVGKTLSEAGWSVDVERAEAVSGLDGYHAAVIGSAIRRGSVLPEIRRFVKARRAELQRIPVAYFVVCMTLSRNTPETRAQADRFLDPLRSEVTPAEVGLFAGKMDYSKLDTGSKLMAKLVGVPAGDFRDWQVIEAWSRRVGSQLAEVS